MFVVGRDAGDRKPRSSSLRRSKLDKILTRAPGEKRQDFGMFFRASSTRLSMEKRSRRNAGKGMARPSTWIVFKRGADPPRNPLMAGGSAASLDANRMHSSAGNGTCITSAIG